VLADHGEMLGERGLWYKMSFFEPACRIPLFIHAPRLFSARSVAQSVSLVDLLPTLLELANDGQATPIAGQLDGHSLLPHLQGSGGHDEVLGEYLAEGAIAPIVMIRSGQQKFIHSPADPDQLFDLATDPDELHNLAAGDQAVNTLRARVAQTWSLQQLHAEVLASQQRRLLVDAALRLGRRTSWDYQPIVDASAQYVRNDQSLETLEASARFPRFSGT
jgi:choline-sulfatase